MINKEDLGTGCISERINVGVFDVYKRVDDEFIPTGEKELLSSCVIDGELYYTYSDLCDGGAHFVNDSVLLNCAQIGVKSDFKVKYTQVNVSSLIDYSYFKQIFNF